MMKRKLDRNTSILVIDDERLVINVLTEMLKVEGHEVESVTNIDDAIKRLQKQEYGVILLDIRMPSKSGIELYEYLKKTNPKLTERVVFITGDVMGLYFWWYLGGTIIAILYSYVVYKSYREKHPKLVETPDKQYLTRV